MMGWGRGDGEVRGLVRSHLYPSQVAAKGRADCLRSKTNLAQSDPSDKVEISPGWLQSRRILTMENESVRTSRNTRIP